MLVKLIDDDWGDFEMEQIMAAVSDQTIAGSSLPYYHQPRGEGKVLINSHGYFEIAVNQDSAARLLKVSRGESVVISL